MLNESFYSRMFWVMVAIAGTVVVTGIGSFISVQVSLASNAKDISNIQGSIAEIKVDLKESGRSRYTAEQAALDRNTTDSRMRSVEDGIKRLTEDFSEIKVWQAKIDQVLSDGKKP